MSKTKKQRNAETREQQRREKAAEAAVRKALQEYGFPMGRVNCGFTFDGVEESELSKIEAEVVVRFYVGPAVINDELRQQADAVIDDELRQQADVERQTRKVSSRP